MNIRLSFDEGSFEETLGRLCLKCGFYDKSHIFK